MKKKITIAIIMTISAAALGGGIYYTWLITPPSLPKTAEEALHTINSAPYNRMPEYRKTEYLEQTRNLLKNMPEEKRVELFERARTDKSTRKAMMAVRRTAMIQRATDYAKATPGERVRMLDEVINRQEQRRKLRDEQRRSNGGKSAGNNRSGTARRSRRRGNIRKRIKGFIEKGNPQRAGLIGEYFS